MSCKIFYLYVVKSGLNLQMIMILILYNIKEASTSYKYHKHCFRRSNSSTTQMPKKFF